MECTFNSYIDAICAEERGLGEYGVVANGKVTDFGKHLARFVSEMSLDLDVLEPDAYNVVAESLGAAIVVVAAHNGLIPTDTPLLRDAVKLVCSDLQAYSILLAIMPYGFDMIWFRNLCKLVEH